MTHDADVANPHTGVQLHGPEDEAPSDGHPHRWRMLALLALAELLGMSLWFSAGAVSPRLRELWGLSPSQAGWLTNSVQLGFVAGTLVAAVLNLADVVPSRVFLAVSALPAAGGGTRRMRRRPRRLDHALPASAVPPRHAPVTPRHTCLRRFPVPPWGSLDNAS